ncbi:hypothetical protein ACP70R_030364 [Stipagrostis hirtigluma subsp. patula]
MEKKVDSMAKRRATRQQDEEHESSSSAKRWKGAPTAVDIGLDRCSRLHHLLRLPQASRIPCALGHVVCSSCHARLPGDKCHMCSVRTATTCYNRCYAVEHILDSVRVPCSNAGHGCAVKTHYHDREEHERTCPHGPCFCPEPGCGFAGTAKLLLRHLAAGAPHGHGWPCTVFRFNEPVSVPIEQGVRILCNDGWHLFLLVMRPAEQQPLRLAVSVLCVQQRAVKRPGFSCMMNYTRRAMDGGSLTSMRPVITTTLSDGIPPVECFPFVVPDPSDPAATDSKLKVVMKESAPTLRQR